MGGSAQESRQPECTTVEVIWQTRSFRCDAELCRKDGLWQLPTAYGAVRAGLGGLDVALVRARKKKRSCGWHLFVVPLKGHVLFGGNNPRANKAARKNRERIAQQHLSAQGKILAVSPNPGPGRPSISDR